MSSGAKFKDVRSQYEILFKEAPPPWENEETTKECIRSAYESSTARIVNSHSAPSQGLNALASTPRLPRAQNPTITLLQKARGQHFRNRNFSISVHSAKVRIKIKKRHYVYGGLLRFHLQRDNCREARLTWRRANPPTIVCRATRDR